MGNGNCAVIGCHNNSKKLENWKELICDIKEHEGKIKELCCQEVLSIFCLFSNLIHASLLCPLRLLLGNMKRRKGASQPCSSDRVCSEHFVDDIPTEHNPDPTLKLGYDKIEVLTRKPPKLRTFVEKKKSTPVSANNSILISPPMSPLTLSSSSSIFNIPPAPPSATIVRPLPLTPSASNPINTSFSFHNEHSSYCKIDPSIECNNCVVKSEIIQQYIKQHLAEVRSLRSRVKSLQQNLQKETERFTPFSVKFIKNDSKMNFYTGITSIKLFDAVFNLLKPHLPKLTYWQGSKNFTKYASKVRPLFRKSSRPRKLAAKDEFLLTLMRIRLGVLNEDLAWSDYKSHNTVKFLVGISPTGYITFLSSCYGGRASDRFVCQDSNFYDGLDLYDEVMADRGFQIHEELMMKFCKLTVPPGARVKSQMTTAEVKKTKEVANLRIHVERAINRIKTYRILQTVMPITILHHCDDIIKVCAALCNLKPLLFVE